MKTFLWTTLFWIVVAIAWLLCLGFGNLWTQVLDNWRMLRVMPKNLKTESCDVAVASAMENIDWCAAAQSYNCYPEETSNETTLDVQWLIDSLNILSTNQETIYNQMNDSFSVVLQNLSALAEMYSSISNVNEPVYYEEPVIDEREQQRLELQAQIEALQNEMNNL